MKQSLCFLFFLCLAGLVFAGSERPKAFIRFHVQVVNQSETSQALPVQLDSPPQQIWIKKYAELAEDNIDTIEMVEGGKVLVTFNHGGQIKLEETTSMNMNRIMVVIVSTNGNARVVYAPIIDTILKDGKFLLPAGITAEELKELQQILKLKHRE